MRAIFSVALLALILFGCGDEKTTEPPDNPYLENSSTTNVLANLAQAYRRQETTAYADLLADDFRFQFDVVIPEFWEKTQDVACTGGLFESPDVEEIRLSIPGGFSYPVNEPGREGWFGFDSPSAGLEVDLRPEAGQSEGVTLRVSGQIQRFFFRKGKTPADTLASSETARRFYLVEWRDLGLGEISHRAPGGTAVGPLIEDTTWGTVKERFCPAVPLPAGGMPGAE